MTESVAKEHATQQVAETLIGGDDLKQVTQKKEDCKNEKESVDYRLLSLVRSQITKIEKGTGGIKKSYDTIKKIESNFKLICELSKNSAVLIDNYDTIRNANKIKRNLKRTSEELTGILEIPEKIENVEILLEQDESMFKIYTELCHLMKFRKQCYILIEKKTDNEEVKVDRFDKPFVFSPEKVKQSPLMIHLKKIKELSDEFLEKLWGQVEDILPLSQDDPTAVIQTMKVIYVEDQIHASLVDELDYKATFQYHLKNFVVSRFQKAKHNAENIHEQLKEVTEVIQDLEKIQTYVEPCVPKVYNITEFFANLYHNQIYLMLSNFKKKQTKLSVDGILSLINWVKKYRETLMKLEIPESNPPLLEDLGFFIKEYVSHMKKNMKQWSLNILKIDNKKCENSDFSKTYSTSTPVDLFISVNTQIETAYKTGGGGFFLFEMACAVAEVLTFFQNKLRGNLSEEKNNQNFDYLCATMNDADKCRESTMNLKDYLLTHLDPLWEKRVFTYDFDDEDDDYNENNENNNKDQEIEEEREIEKENFEIQKQNTRILNLDTVGDGFSELSKNSINRMIKLFYNDLEETFNSLFSEQWYDEESELISTTIIETFRDYLKSMKGGAIFTHLFKKIVNQTIDLFLIQYLTHLMNGQKKLEENTEKIIIEDIERYEEFFFEYLGKKVYSKFEPLRLFAELATSSLTTIIMPLGKIINKYPDFKIELAEAVLAKRIDFDRKSFLQQLETFKQNQKNNSTNPKNENTRTSIFSKLKIQN
ncbi:exocyst complex component [Anaeramoeba flamelloides]|uniref:Exocyst complex component n=1 Tax=Anaeramoeba flamelloides TaxID=1746091 RepID=A0AAV7Y9U7_9EUKA|nr:exocyst complex component [Anaeramoeba flamelloides]